MSKNNINDKTWEILEELARAKGISLQGYQTNDPYIHLYTSLRIFSGKSLDDIKKEINLIPNK